MLVTTQPGGGSWGMTTVYSTLMDKTYGDEVETKMTPTGTDLPTANDMWNGPSNGSVMFQHHFATMVGDWMTRPEQVEYDPFEYPLVGAMNFRTLSMTLSQHHEKFANDLSNWEWSYDDFVENIGDLRWGTTTFAGHLLGNAMEAFDPRLSDGDVEIIPFESYAQTAQAMRAGDLEGYIGSFESNMATPEVHKPQVAISSSAYPSWDNAIREGAPDVNTLEDSSFPEDRVDTVVELNMDGRALWVPPETPDSLLQKHREAFAATLKDEHEELRHKLFSRFFGDHVFVDTGSASERAFNFTAKKAELFEEHQDLMPDVAT
jgi:hypothetical protein